MIPSQVILRMQNHRFRGTLDMKAEYKHEELTTDYRLIFFIPQRVNIPGYSCVNCISNPYKEKN